MRVIDLVVLIQDFERFAQFVRLLQDYLENRTQLLVRVVGKNLANVVDCVTGDEFAELIYARKRFVAITKFHDDAVCFAH